MKKIILATQNIGKVHEFKQMMLPYDIEVQSLLDINYLDDIEETGTTFEENALIKARMIALRYQTAVVADDSGLEIDALRGAPGVYSARYAGEGRCDDANMNKVLVELKDVPDHKRSARFVCALALVDEKGVEQVVHGTCEGMILHEKRGKEGFGYDPIFYLPQLDKTMAELSKDEKNALSHRGNAFKKLASLVGEMR